MAGRMARMEIECMHEHDGQWVRFILIVEHSRAVGTLCAASGPSGCKTTSTLE